MKLKVLKSKKLFALLLAVTMIICSLPMSAIAEGTNEGTIKEIRTIEELYNVRDDLTANYILMNDIDLTEATAKGGDYDFYGNGWNPIGSNDVYGNGEFTGTFDGNGHTIKGLRIDVTTLPSGTAETVYIGLFANASGDIKNLTVTGSVKFTYNDKKVYAGTFVGYTTANIEKCVNKADVSITDKYASTNHIIYAGGLAGYSTGKVSHCINNGLIEVSGGCHYGYKDKAPIVFCSGLIGLLSEGCIDFSYNVGKIYGVSSGGHSYWMSNNYTGWDQNEYQVVYSSGICYSENSFVNNSYNAGEIISLSTGSNTTLYSSGIECGSATVTNCYNVGTITGANSNYAIGTGTLTNCYYLTGLGSSSTGATSLSQAQMKTKSMYKGFDFEKVWIENEYAKYAFPQLRSNPQNLDEAVEEISLVSEPNKKFCYKGGKLDCTGGKIEVIYVSGNVTTVDITSDMLTFDNETLGVTTVTVTFDDKTLTFETEIKEYPTATKIELLSAPDDTTYIKNRTVDYTGAKIKVTFNDQSTEIIDVTESMVTGIDIQKSGEYTATVTFSGLKTTFKATVVAFRVTGIAIKSLPTKTEYIENEDISYQGLAIVLTYNDGTTKSINRSLCNITGYNGKVGKNTVTVEYSGYTTTFDINVVERDIKSIEIESLPTKLKFVAGQQLDTKGLIVKANYNNGEVGEITGYKLSGFDSQKIGLQTVTVNYKEFVASFTVKVVVKQIENFEIVKAPLKTEYNEGEKLDLTGLEVKATYNDGEVTAPKDFGISGYSSTPGNKTVMLSYEGMVDSFAVNVHQKQLSGIEIVKPKKESYYVGDSLDTTGLKVYSLYDNGDKIELNGFEYSLSGFDSTKTGVNTVNVSYESYVKSFVVTVVNRPVSNTEFTLSSAKARLNENVTVYVSVNNNSGISGLCQTIKFNKDKFEFVSAKLEDNFKGMFIVTDDYKANGEITVLWSEATDNCNNTAVYSLTFKVKDNVSASTENIIISGTENSVCNAAGELIVPTYNSGIIDVLDWWIGDLDGDRDYSMSDIITLAQYVANKPMVLTEKQKLSADVNEDGIIDIRDVTLLSQMIVNKDI